MQRPPRPLPMSYTRLFAAALAACLLVPALALAQAPPAKPGDPVPEGVGYLVMDVVAVVALVAALAWGVWRYRASRRGRGAARPTDDAPRRSSGGVDG